jgi:hypothetical protein
MQDHGRRIRHGGLVVSLATVLALTLALAPRAEAFVYWTNPLDRAIGRANLDGTGVDNSFITGVGPQFGNDSVPDGVAVNSTHLYWVSSGVRRSGGVLAQALTIGRANLDGTAPNHRLIANVSASGWRPGIAVDDAHVYWVSRFADEDSNPGTGAIGRANLDGTGVDENFITGLEYPHEAVAVDGSHLYWTILSQDPFPTHRIGRANLDGTGVDENFITLTFEALSIPGLAVDDEHVWWSSSARFNAAIDSANLDGTGTERVINIGEEDDYDESVCGGVAVDNTHLYWTNRFGIGRARLDGTRVNHDFITTDPCGRLAVDGLGPLPSNEFAFGSVKKNKKRGTAKLTVKVPGPGELVLDKNAKVKGTQEGADAAGKQKLPIKPRRKAKQKLAAKGEAKVKAEVTYTPDGGEPNTRTRGVRLIKRS